MQKPVAAIIGLAGFLLPWFLPLEGLSQAGVLALGLFLFAAIFWVLEPVPVYATSMLVILGQLFFFSTASPFVEHFDFPYPAEDAAPPERFFSTLAHPILILFLGGFLLAGAAVKYSLEKNLTRILLAPFGNSSRMLLLGMMLSTAVLSAFMSNTATTAMMITVILPLIAVLAPEDRFRTALALSIPLAANLGGVATPIGTPPNAVAIAALDNQGISVAFSTWMMIATPLVVISLLIGWGLLLVLFPPRQKHLDLQLSGKFQTSSKAILLYIVGGLTVLLWITEKLHGIPASVIAFLPVALLPALGVVGKTEIRGISWEVLWLVAGGISLGYSLQATGLAEWMIALVDWESLGHITMLAAFLAVTIAMANFLSNTVTAALLIPIALSLGTSGAIGNGSSAVLLAIAIAVGSSYGMSLPISTPPNAIAMSTGLIRTPQMASMGIVMGILGFGIVAAAALWFWPLFFSNS